MDKELENPAGGKTSSPAVDANLEAGRGAAAGVADSRNDSAASLAIEHEGNKGGRGRADKLVPGSESAIKADKLYDCIRHWQDRNPGQIHPQEKSLHAAKQKFFADRRKPLPAGQPLSPVTRIAVVDGDRPLPPLPSAVPATVPEIGSQAALLDDARSALVRWAGTDIEPLLVELIKLLEEWREFAREKKLMLARLPQVTIDEINLDAAWNERPVKILCESGSRVLAKLLNAGGISAEYKDEIFCGLAAILIAGSEIRTMRRINKLIVVANAGTRQNKPVEQK